MNWELFWGAFGAIGTTVGSLITAAAVVIAVKQYRQPLIKRLRIRCNAAMPIGLNTNTELICIGVSNTGIRPINVANICLNVGKKDLIINYAQFTIPGVLPALTFPAELQPEQEIEMYLEYRKLAQYIAEECGKGTFQKKEKVKVAVMDKTGGRYLHPMGYTVRQLAEARGT